MESLLRVFCLLEDLKMRFFACYCERGMKNGKKVSILKIFWPFRSLKCTHACIASCKSDACIMLLNLMHEKKRDSIGYQLAVFF